MTLLARNEQKQQGCWEVDIKQVCYPKELTCSKVFTLVRLGTAWNLTNKLIFFEVLVKFEWWGLVWMWWMTGKTFSLLWKLDTKSNTVRLQTNLILWLLKPLPFEFFCWFKCFLCVCCMENKKLNRRCSIQAHSRWRKSGVSFLHSV